MLKFARVSLLALAITVSLSSTVKAQISLVINEFMASNSSIEPDPQGEYDDWIEIYNYGHNDIDIGGMYLTDNLSAPTKWLIPIDNPAETNIPAGGYILVWADEDTTDPGLHAYFKLNAGGEEIGLFDSDGITLIDSLTFGEQTTDVSYGRFPDATNNLYFFATPTPGTENTDAYLGEIEDPSFSHNRGFYDTPFAVTIATETEGAEIYYSLDGSEPYRISPRGLILGTLYTGPVQISETTCLRVQAIKADWKPSDIKTQTYIFVSDVIRQSPYGQAPGPDWPVGSVNGQVINYGMDPDIVNDPQYSSLMEDALLAIPTISLVTDLRNLFHSNIGIYVHARQEGREWERPTSVELINPDGSEGFQIDAGIRIRGGFSRSGSNPKHAFRLFFRSEYSNAKLRFALFEDEGIDEYKNVDLRTSQNYSWSFQGSSQNTMVREVFSRDLQGDMGQPYNRSRYYHLYINGHYWGIFQTQERPEASYAESYLGGYEEDYDVAKMEREQAGSMIATDGNLEAYRRLYDATMEGFNDNIAYYRAQGMNPDGTPNSDYERLLDVDNLIDFMITEYYTSDRDGPGSRYGNRPNNTYCIYNRENPDGWKFFQHDSEHTLGVPGDAENMVYPLTSAGRQWRYFNPHWLHEQLIISNENYRQLFGDRIQKHLFNDGVLTPEAATARIDARAAQIELAIIAESARWGDATSGRPRTKDDWLNALDYVRSWINNRNPILLNQFRSQNWFPSIDAPSFSQHGGKVENPFELFISAPTGTIFYSLDGSDPRIFGSEVNPIEHTILIAENADKRVFVPTGPVGNDWRDSNDYDDSAWLSCTGSPGGVGYERTSGYQDLLSLNVHDQMYARNATCYIRIPFDIEAEVAEFGLLTLKVRYDDGFVAYINGIEVARRNLNGTPMWNSNASASNSDFAAVVFENIDISDSLSVLQEGNNLLAIHGLNATTTSSDFLISSELIAREGGSDTEGVIEYTTGPITLTHSTQVKAWVLEGDTWSALNEAIFAIGPLAKNLRITEIMYHPQAPTDVNDPSEEFIELTNIGEEPINLNLVSFTNGIDFTFPNMELAPDEYIVVVENIDAFESRYGTNINIAGEYTGKLRNNGERIKLEDAIGQTILDFSYSDNWRSITDGEGFSLTIIDPTNPDPNSWGYKDSWRASASEYGSPGEDDSGIIPNPGAVVINELLANSPGTAPDWIELYNTTGTSIDIGGWFLSDNDNNPAKYKIAAGTTIGPDQYIVFYQDMHFGNTDDPGSNEPFALSNNGETVILSSTEGGVLTGYRNVEDFGASQTGVSFGRYYKSSTDNYNFVAMDHNTPGSENAYPKVGPIVINEIMYNPDWPDGGSYTNDQYEYIELYNISAEPVNLQGWKFTDGIDFTFPDNTPVTISAGEYVLVVKEPDAFAWRYLDVPAELIFGPYDGRLSNAGESLELGMPNDEMDGSGEPYYIRIDRVNYSDGSHPENCPGGVDLWPLEADGDGSSLHRISAENYGNDPVNWIASTPSPGE